MIDRIELRLARFLRVLFSRTARPLETLVDEEGMIPRAPLASLCEANAHDERYFERRVEFYRRLDAVERVRFAGKRMLTNGFRWSWMPRDQPKLLTLKHAVRTDAPAPVALIKARKIA